MLENRKEKEIGIAFLEPRQSPKVEKDNRIELCTVKGRVIDINGAPRSEVKVKIQNALIGTTNEYGEYIIKNVPMGTYSIRAVSGNKESGKKDIVVNESQESPFEIIFPNPIKEMLFCEEIQKYRYLDENVEWVIIGQSDDFPSTIEKVICYIEVIGAEKNMVIKHRWFWHDRLEFEIPLEVKSSNWRSFSEKIIAPEKTGTWRVEVIKEDDDTVLASRSFTVR